MPLLNAFNIQNSLEDFLSEQLIERDEMRREIVKLIRNNHKNIKKVITALLAPHINNISDSNKKQQLTAALNAFFDIYQDESIDQSMRDSTTRKSFTYLLNQDWIPDASLVVIIELFAHEPTRKISEPIEYYFVSRNQDKSLWGLAFDGKNQLIGYSLVSKKNDAEYNFDYLHVRIKKNRGDKIGQGLIMMTGIELLKKHYYTIKKLTFLPNPYDLKEGQKYEEMLPKLRGMYKKWGAKEIPNSKLMEVDLEKLKANFTPEEMPSSTNSISQIPSAL